MKIAIIGAGPAGVEAARVIRQGGGEALLFSSEAALPYYRPKLIAYAFGEVALPGIQIRPPAWYAETGIELRLDACIEGVSLHPFTVHTCRETIPVDALILAAGANPFMPPCFPTGCPTILPLWNLDHAEAIRRGIRAGGRLALVGGGILGVEAALRATEAGIRVTLIELQDRLMATQFGALAAAALAAELRGRGIDVRLQTAVTHAVMEGQEVVLNLTGGDAIRADLCLVSAGARPKRDLAQALGLQVGRGVVVDTHLATSRLGIWASGDVIELNGSTRCSMREAMSQGRIAGANALASLRGESLRVYKPEVASLSMSCSQCELYSAGELAAPGTEERILEGTVGNKARVLILRDGRPVGVQMVGTREGFDGYLAEIKRAG